MLLCAGGVSVVSCSQTAQVSLWAVSMGAEEPRRSTRQLAHQHYPRKKRRGSESINRSRTQDYASAKVRLKDERLLADLPSLD